MRRVAIIIGICAAIVLLFLGTWSFSGSTAQHMENESSVDQWGSAF